MASRRAVLSLSSPLSGVPKEAAVPTFDIEVTRDGCWQMIHVPEIDQLTQACHSGEIDDMARELIAVSTGVPIEDVAVRRWTDYFDTSLPVKLLQGEDVTALVPATS